MQIGALCPTRFQFRQECLETARLARQGRRLGVDLLTHETDQFGTVTWRQVQAKPAGLCAGPTGSGAFRLRIRRSPRCRLQPSPRTPPQMRMLRCLPELKPEPKLAR